MYYRLYNSISFSFTSYAFVSGFIITLCFLQPSYKQDYEKSKEKNVFKPTDTEQYKALKENEKTSSDVSQQKIKLIV